MSYESVQETGGIYTTRKQVSWKLKIVMDPGRVKRRDGLKGTIGRTRLTSWYVPPYRSRVESS